MPHVGTQEQTEYEHSTFEVAVKAISADLVQTFSRVLGDLPGAPHRPQQLAKSLELNKDLASRLVRALRKRDPLAAMHVMPGPLPLRRVLDSAEQAGASKDAVVRATSAVEAFERFIRTEFGSRANLDVAIASTLPDVRERDESAAKQASYRGAVGVRGISVDVILGSIFVHPSRVDPLWCDSASVCAYFGLRRIRSDAHFEFTTFRKRTGPPTPEHDEEQGGAGTLESSAVIPEFCSPAELPLDITAEGDTIRYVMTGNEVGQRSAMDVVIVEDNLKIHPINPSRASLPKHVFFATVDQPTALLVFDVFVHKDVWPGCDPELAIYDTVIKGVVWPKDQSRERDRLNLAETLTFLGDHPSGFHNADVPQYAQILEHVCGSHGWNLGDFRGYGTRISYPFYGSQTCMVFRQFAQ